MKRHPGWTRAGRALVALIAVFGWFAIVASPPVMAITRDACLNKDYLPTEWGGQRLPYAPSLGPYVYGNSPAHDLPTRNYTVLDPVTGRNCGVTIGQWDGQGWIMQRHSGTCRDMSISSPNRAFNDGYRWYPSTDGNPALPLTLWGDRVNQVSAPLQSCTFYHYVDFIVSGHRFRATPNGVTHYPPAVYQPPPPPPTTTAPPPPPCDPNCCC